MDFQDIGLKVPHILLPNENVNMTKWAVVACDQYTSEPEYWEKADKLIGGEPSTLRITFPEVYLERPDKEERIKNINATMEDYVEKGILKDHGECFILVDRKVPPSNKSRKGLVVALDLEKYDYNKGSQTLIRATEGTILDRIPPRVQIRENAPIELPHIMVLLDDPEKKVIEPLFNEKLTKVYDFDLMMDSGHITGYKIDDPKLIELIAFNIRKLANKEGFETKYQVKDVGTLLYAMGDGNHSLATAKAIWEKTKEDASDKERIINHPSRYALVELVNVHDEGLEFEPIHRVVFNANIEHMLKDMEDYYKNKGCNFSYKTYESKDEAVTKAQGLRNDDFHVVTFVNQDKFGNLLIKNPAYNLEVASLQNFLDLYLQNNKDSSIDYIHGESVVQRLSKEESNIGFILKGMDKNQLFKSVIVDGALPRKTFSMGEAEEKRFYLEARKIK
ncbi:MAG: DUF1015 domain-containing protein [Bacteriovoracia bacterium]